MSYRQSVAVLGATGSIGCHTLDVIAHHPERFELFALSGYQNLNLLAQQIVQFRPKVVVVPNEQAKQSLCQLLPPQISFPDFCFGEDGLCAVAGSSDVDIVMAAIVGAAGLAPTLAAAVAGKRILLANKESLVVGGALLMDAVARSGAVLMPIDSEHNAIFQCLPERKDRAGVASIVLTASGGPFLNFSLAEMARVTPEQACAHPNWVMGQKISVDSATLMNKGLEFIEACWLFDLSPNQVEVLIHPQSVIHSMVRYLDGSVLAQLGEPDMRIPIAYGLAWPERIQSGVAELDFTQLQALTFMPPDLERFPCLSLAADAFRAGPTVPVILNAANEVAVAAFLARSIRFTDIAEVVAATLGGVDPQPATDLSTLIELDQTARAAAFRYINKSYSG